MRKGISQEGLKCLACVTMLIDHVGAVLMPSALWLRLIGRIAFPIYCFLLAEGAEHTSNGKKYGLRLFIGMILSELPFDIAIFGRPTWAHQNVMVTLMLGYLAICAMKKAGNTLTKMLIALPFAVIAQALGSDYGGFGVMLIVMFYLVRRMPHSLLWQTLGLGLISWEMGIVEMPALLAMIPIGLYSGEKKSRSRTLQWAFYLFYPVHLAALAVLAVLAGKI